MADLKTPVVDLNRFQPKTEAEELIACEIIEDQYTYHDWEQDQKTAGAIVVEALKTAALVIVTHVPPSADRSAALRKLREARMDANSAISHRGKY